MVQQDSSSEASEAHASAAPESLRTDSDCQPSAPEPMRPGFGCQPPSASETARPAPRPRTLFVDADACPVTRDALAAARRRRVPVVLAGNSTQNLERHIRRDDPRSPEEARRGFWVDVLSVGVGADSADFAIVERLQPGDVVVTQDIGLASMALGRGSRAIGVRGRVYDPATIDAQLLIRHEEKKVRRAGGRTKGPDPFTNEDRARFVRNLERLLE